jgi:Spy/CpxP family protein refolding chaperone
MKSVRIMMFAIGLAAVLALPAHAQMMGGMGGSGMQGAPGGMSRMGEGMEHHGNMTHGSHMGMPPSHESPQITLMLQHGRELGLSADQERKLRDLRTEYAKESARKGAEIQVAEIDLGALLEQDRWDMPKIEAAAKQAAGLQADLRVARLKAIALGRALLTPDQLQKLKELGHQMQPASGHGPMRPGMGMHGMGGSHPGTPGQGNPQDSEHQHHTN